MTYFFHIASDKAGATAYFYALLQLTLQPLANPLAVRYHSSPAKSKSAALQDVYSQVLGDTVLMDFISWTFGLYPNIRKVCSASRSEHGVPVEVAVTPANACDHLESMRESNPGLELVYAVTAASAPDTAASPGNPLGKLQTTTTIHQPPTYPEFV